MRITPIIATLALATSLSGCTIGPGDYVVIRIAATTGQSTSCYPDGIVPPDEAMDRTDIRGGANLVIFASDKESYWLEFGNASFPGTRDGKDYSFSGEDVDVDDNGMGPIRTRVVLHDMQLTIAGSSVEGTYTIEARCTADDMDNCPIPSCVTTTDFVGTIVRGVDLEYDLQPAQP